ncbi:MAG: HEAT repeat domain-containing protein [Myxococcota bacterium]
MRRLAMLLIGACTTTTEPALDQPLSEGDRQAAVQFGTTLTQPSPPAIVCSTHQGWLTHLAATTDDPATAAAALTGLAECSTTWHEPDVRRALARWWSQPTPVLAKGLIAVADPLVATSEPDDPVVRGMVRLASLHPELAVKLAALESLDRRAWGREPEVASAFIDAMLAVRQPVLTATVLHWLRFEASEVHFQVQPRLRAAATLALRDIDPGVRGRAALALARLAGDDPQILALVRERLADPHPFTRAAAAKALADLAQETLVHDLVPLLDDHAATTWRSRPFARLDGTTDRIRFVASPHERVDEAVLIGLQRLTADLARPYVIRSIDPTYAELDLLSATRDAKAWYQAAYGEESPPEEGG